jgi:hypothetical protein
MLTVSERAAAYNLPPQATTPTAGTELAVRPKVLRRPAHFNAKANPIASPAPVLVPMQSVPQAMEKSAPAFRAWQDDGKFAITLLALVILVNVIVSTWLAAITPEKPVAASAISTPAAEPVQTLDSTPRDISEQ